MTAILGYSRYRVLRYYCRHSIPFIYCQHFANQSIRRQRYLYSIFDPALHPTTLESLPVRPLSQTSYGCLESFMAPQTDCSGRQLCIVLEATYVYDKHRILALEFCDHITTFYGPFSVPLYTYARRSCKHRWPRLNFVRHTVSSQLCGEVQ